MRTIFVVDDDADTAEAVAQALAACDRNVRAFADPYSALEALRHEPCDLMVADLRMPWLDGHALATEARRLRPALPIIFVSGYDEGAAVAARDRVRFFAKPVDPGQLRQAVDELTGETCGVPAGAP